jgi:hypothetical protein
MTKGQTFRTVGAAVALSAALAACGGGGSGGAKTPSALDPANMVPASSVAYAEVAIRPQGSMRSDLVEAINSIAGPGAAQKLSASWAKSTKNWKNIKPWLGQRAGIALTAVPATGMRAPAIENDLLIVFPTSDPSAARKALLKGHPPAWETAKIVGHYVLVGGKNGVGAGATTKPGSSLTADAGFKADIGQLGSDEVLSVYAPLHQLYQELLPLLQSSPTYSASTLSAAAKQAPPGSSVAFGMAALHNQFRIDVVSNGIPTTNTPASAVPSEVGSLPASSWLALTLGGALAKGSTLSELTSNLSKELAAIQSLSGKVGGRVPGGPLQFVVKDLLPALGPAEFSVSGTSRSTLQAGVVMAPDNVSAGARLAKAVKQLVNGLPISATTTGGRLAVTFGISNLAQLLDPSSKLSANPTFKRALAQLPAGAKADIYLNFEPIAVLASLDQGTVSSSGMKVLHRLDYLIAGGTHSHFRLVLTTY